MTGKQRIALDEFKKYLESKVDLFIFELNDTSTREIFKRIVESEIQKFISPDQFLDYKVVCDDTNNPNEVIERGQFWGDIYLKTNEDADWFKLNVTLQHSPVTFKEIQNESSS